MRFSDPFGWVWGLATGVAPSHLRSPMQLYCRNPRTWPHVSERNRRVSSSEGDVRCPQRRLETPNSVPVKVLD